MFLCLILVVNQSMRGTFHFQPITNLIKNDFMTHAARGGGFGLKLTFTEWKVIFVLLNSIGPAILTKRVWSVLSENAR